MRLNNAGSPRVSEFEFEAQFERPLAVKISNSGLIAGFVAQFRFLAAAQLLHKQCAEWFIIIFAASLREATRPSWGSLYYLILPLASVPTHSSPMIEAQCVLSLHGRC